MPNTRDIWRSSPTGWPNWPLLSTVLNRLTIDKGTTKRHCEIVDEERKRLDGVLWVSSTRHD